MSTERKQAICGVCPGGCAIVATLEDGRLVKAEPDTDNPYGTMCVRGRAAPEILYSPDRLATPLLRQGARGEGKFRPATWDEALDRVAAAMKDVKEHYGAPAMVYHFGRGVMEQSMGEFGSKWLYPFGSPNVASVGSLCAVAFMTLAPVPTFGFGAANMLPDIENSALIVVWGANPLTDSPPLILPRIIKAHQRGARLVAIDHIRCDIARRADEWVPIRSGTDGALALGMLRVVINEKLYDASVVDNWTTGFNALKEYVQQFTPPRVEEITHVPARTVVRLAREIAGTRHVPLVMYTGLEYTNSGVQNIRAVYLLWALTGHLDEMGGQYVLLAKSPPIETQSMKPPAGVKPIGAAEFPLFYDLVSKAPYQAGCAHYTEFPRAVTEGKPYPVKGLILHGAQTLVNYPQPEIYARAYCQLDFMAVIDIFPTEDMKYADVVLPASTLFEVKSYQRYPDYARLRERVVAPVGQSRGDLMILAAIARRLGYGNLLPQTEEEVLTRAFGKAPELLQRLKADPAGVKLLLPERRYKKWETGGLRPDGKPGFDTPSGKVEIASSILAQHGYEALPVYVDPVEGPLASPALAEQFPLVLNTGARLINTFRSQHLNIPSLVKLQEKPAAIINKQDAAKRGIKNGDPIIVRTKRGEVQLWASVDEVAAPGEVEVNVGGGSPIQVEAWRNANANRLTDLYNRDPISGFPVFKALLCEVEKANV